MMTTFFPIFLMILSGEKSLSLWNVTQNRIEHWKTWQNPTQVLLSDDLSTLIEFTPFSQNLLFALAPSGLASTCRASFHLSNFFFSPPPSDQWGVILVYNWDLPACRLCSCFGMSPVNRFGERIHLSADGQWLLVGTRLSNDKYSTVSYAPHGFLFWPSTESTDICLRAVSTQDGAEQTVPFVDPSSWYATLLKKGHIIHVQNDGAGKVVRLVNPAINQVIPLNKPGNGRVSVWMNGEDWAYIYSASTGFTGGLIKNNHHHTNNFSLPEIAIHELLFVPGKTQVVFRYATMDRTPGWLAPWLERWGWQQYSPFRSISYFGLYDWATGEWLAEWRAPQRTPFMQISADGTQLGVSWHDSDNDSALHIDRYDLSEPRYSRWWARIAAGSAFFLSTGLVLRLRRRQPSFAYAQRLEDKVR